MNGDSKPVGERILERLERAVERLEKLSQGDRSEQGSGRLPPLAQPRLLLNRQQIQDLEAWED